MANIIINIPSTGSKDADNDKIVAGNPVYFLHMPHCQIIFLLIKVQSGEAISSKSDLMSPSMASKKKKTNKNIKKMVFQAEKLGLVDN